MSIECDATVQVGRDIFNRLNTDIERDAIRMYLISDFIDQMEYKYGVSTSVNIEDVFGAGYGYIEGRDETPPLPHKSRICD